MFVGPAACPPRSGCSIISNVFENGFAGVFLGLWTASSSDVFEVVLSKGSSSRGIGVGGFADIEYVSSPIVEVESGIEGESGGGDWTRTFFVIFFGASIFSRSVEPDWKSACRYAIWSNVGVGLSGAVAVVIGGPFLLKGLEEGRSADIFEDRICAVPH
jgi:hypothetical protein